MPLTSQNITLNKLSVYAYLKMINENAIFIVQPIAYNFAQQTKKSV